MIAILILMSLFIAKHFICDFCFQFNYMLAEKGTYWAKGGLHHALIHAAGTFLVLSVVIYEIEWAVVFALFDGIIHYHIDWCKVQLSRGLTATDRQFWIWIGLDQALHCLTYVLIIAILFIL